MPEIVDPAQGLDPSSELRGLPLAVTEVVQVEVTRAYFDQSHALHELARDEAMITEPGNSERPLAGPFGLRIGRADQAASAS